MIKQFNEIKTRNELANFLGIKTGTLTYVLYKLGVDNLYTTFTIPKKNGEERLIHSPVEPLKFIQKSLVNSLIRYQKNITNKFGTSSNISHGFIKNKSIITNASIHRNKRYIFNIDLKDFFPSFHFGRVRGYFEKNKYFNFNREIATIIAQLTCYNGSLPQGSPTSPIITNLICSILDYQILKVAKKYKTDYTRYADDLTFSTNDRQFKEDYKDFLRELTNIVEIAGFEINNSKTRFQFKDSRQEVTGLTVNNKLNTNKQFRKNTKAMAHRLYSTGSFEIDGKEGTINQLEGRFSFINQLDYYNNISNGNDKISKTLSQFNLNSRERTYQEFLYYKYFIKNDKPLVITEGKTDIKYLKAALKKHSNDYPLLISHGIDESLFKLSFLNRASRLKYFFNLQEEGADSLQNIFNMYTGKNNFPNYWKDLVEKYNIATSNPVILVYDNENSNKKPLQKILKSIKSTVKFPKNNFHEELETNQFTNIIGNLYLLTNPSIEGKFDSEIEDLFDDETLDTVLGGKKFSRNKAFDLKKHYGKEIFANHIFDNYRKINFDDFKPMLDNITTIIESCNNIDES